MTEAYQIVKVVYDGHFSDDPKKAATDPLFYMLERLFFLFNEEKTMEKVDQFMGKQRENHETVALLHFTEGESIEI